MPKPKSPEKPDKYIKKKFVKPKILKPIYTNEQEYHTSDNEYHTSDNEYEEQNSDSQDNTQWWVDNTNFKNIDFERYSKQSRITKPEIKEQKQYPSAIRELLNICTGELYEVKSAFKNRNRQKYVKIFECYKKNLSERDYSIVKGALYYVYEFSRTKSIDLDTALWMIGIHEIPTSQIVSYTSKDILKNIARNHGLSFSNKNSEELIEEIRGVVDPSV